MQLSTAYLTSPLGILTLVANETALVACEFNTPTFQPVLSITTNPLLLRASEQLNEYFQGKRYQFDLPLSIDGSTFYQQVWQQLQVIEYGKTMAYGELAQAMGRPKAARAVGQANHHNPISIIIPCHRVIGKSGKLVGYDGELWRKEWLLNHEKKHAGF